MTFYHFPHSNTFAHRQPKLTLPWNRSRSPQGQDAYKFVELHSLMLHAKFQNYRPSGFGEDFLNHFAINSSGSHLGHVTRIIYTKIHSPFESINIIYFTSIIQKPKATYKYILEGLDVGVMWSNVVEET